MFLKPEDEATIHYGTDPLIGFHLALAGVPLEAQNPLFQTLKESPDYITGNAPLIFDVIDTSNLCDHLHPLVLLAAVTPLLRNTVSSILYTEVMIKRNRRPTEILENLLCGDIPTVVNLGPFPN